MTDTSDIADLDELEERATRPRSGLFKVSTIIWALLILAIFVIISRMTVMTGTKSTFQIEDFQVEDSTPPLEQSAP